MNFNKVNISHFQLMFSALVRSATLARAMECFSDNAFLKTCLWVIVEISGAILPVHKRVIPCLIESRTLSSNDISSTKRLSQEDKMTTSKTRLKTTQLAQVFSPACYLESAGSSALTCMLPGVDCSILRRSAMILFCKTARPDQQQHNNNKHRLIRLRHLS